MSLRFRRLFVVLSSTGDFASRGLPTGRDSDALVAMATLKRARLMEFS